LPSPPFSILLPFYHSYSLKTSPPFAKKIEKAIEIVFSVCYNEAVKLIILSRVAEGQAL
jgi:hypothetical protein